MSTPHAMVKVKKINGECVGTLIFFPWPSNSTFRGFSMKCVWNQCVFYERLYYHDIPWQKSKELGLILRV